ncbi:MAG TPA: sugar phosphate nucleotidyltransferase, partial [Chitinophagaceae bacterium]|nr:sugar phosphate nucleotidyltransferase [Chitinophagaceae bacterium]
MGWRWIAPSWARDGGGWQRSMKAEPRARRFAQQMRSELTDAETIMDYSIYDAIEAGYGKIVFIIRKDFAADFKAIFEPKLQGRIKAEYAFQDLDDYLGEFKIPEGRVKPWGTSHAIMCAQEFVREPFTVINADDFYGKDAFVKSAAFLNTACKADVYGLMGYQLANTLSANGSVSRGVCKVDEQDNLVEINERLKIYRENGQMVFEETDGSKTPLDENTKASMNFWCFHPSLFDYLQKEFKTFLQQQGTELKSEFLIPRTADQWVKDGNGVIKVLPTNAQWFGVTYKEDAPVVKENLAQLVQSGVYPQSLWNLQNA